MGDRQIFRINDKREEFMQGKLEFANAIWKLTNEALVKVHQVHKDFMTDENSTLVL